MKMISRILSLLVLAGLTAFYVSCKSDDPVKSVQQQQFEKLVGAWSLTDANDGTPRTADFPSLVLTLSGTFVEGGTYNYSFTGTRPNPSPWPLDGTWRFGTDPAEDIIRDKDQNEVSMKYTVTGNVLTLNFNVPSGSTGWAGGTSRIDNVSGDWTFVFQKQ